MHSYFSLQESGDAAQERSLKKLPELEESKKLFMSRPSLAYLGLSSDEDPGACADKMQVGFVGNSNMRFIQGGLGKLDED